MIIIYYYHIPKTGGMSILSCFEDICKKIPNAKLYNFMICQKKPNIIPENINFQEILSEKNIKKYNYIFIHHHHGYYGLMHYKDIIIKKKDILKKQGHTLKVITTIRDVISFNISRFNFIKNKCIWIPEESEEDYLIKQNHYNIQTKYFYFNHHGEWPRGKITLDIINYKLSNTSILDISNVIDIFIETNNLTNFLQYLYIICKLKLDKDVKLNTSQHNITFSKYYKELIKVNNYDYNLYEIYKNKFFNYKYLNNTNTIWGQIDQPKTSNNKITYYGEYHTFEDIDTSLFTDKVLVWHRPEFPKEEWRYGLYGIKYKPRWNYIKEEDVMTIELPQPVYTPIYIEKYHIYDVFYNDNGEYIIIMPQIPDDDSLPLSIKLNSIEFQLEINNYIHCGCYIYYCKAEYQNIIQLQINNEIIETKVNKYPEFPDEIIMTTMVKNEDNYIRQWIDYHHNLGIQRFIIYDNSEIDDGLSHYSYEERSHLPNVLKDYIDKDMVVLIQWPYKKELPTKTSKYIENSNRNNNENIGLNVEHNNHIGQSCQMNHAVYLFKTSKYIGKFDIDEYINLQQATNLPSFFENLILKENIDIDNVGGFSFYNKFFYNPDNLPEDGTKFFNIYNCSEIIKYGHEKMFILPKNVNSVAIHKIANGKETYFIDEKYGYLNHYYFLNKHNRGKKRTEFEDKSILKYII